MLDDKTLEKSDQSTIPQNDYQNMMQIPLNSKDDILAELILIQKHNVQAISKWPSDDMCPICFDTLKDQYTLQYPCGDPKHSFHRNCILSNIIVYNRGVQCAVCSLIPKSNDA